MKFSMYSGFSPRINSLGPERAADSAASLGFSGVELFCVAKKEYMMSLEDAAKYKNIFSERGLSVACYSAAGSLARYDNIDEVNEDVLSCMLHCVEVAAALGSKNFHHTLFFSLEPEHSHFDFERIYKTVLPAAKKIAARAAELGVTVLYEPQGFYFNGLESFSRFFDEMLKEYSNVGVCGDVGNSLWVDEPVYEIFKKYINYIPHVHLKDYILGDPEDMPDVKQRTRSGRAIKDVPIGAGEIDLKRIFTMLKGVNYSGFVSLEHGGAGGDLDAEAKIAMKLAEEIYNNI